MLLDELRKFAKMPFLMKHLTSEFSLCHDSVEMRRNNPVKRSAGGVRKKVNGLKMLSGRRNLRYIIVPFTSVEVEVERAGEKDFDLYHVMDVPRLWWSRSTIPFAVKQPCHVR